MVKFIEKTRPSGIKPRAFIKKNDFLAIRLHFQQLTKSQKRLCPVLQVRTTLVTAFAQLITKSLQLLLHPPLSKACMLKGELITITFPNQKSLPYSPSAINGNEFGLIRFKKVS